jgi:hypothetical protein
MRTSRLLALIAALTLAAAPARAQQDGRTGLAREGLAGQTVAVLPFTLVVRDTALAHPVLQRDRVEVLRWADSVFGDALVLLAPEIGWMLPPELRRVARRNVGVVQDPDRMGHAVMRSPQLTSVPDPTRSQLRTLVAFFDGRLVLIPAGLVLGPGDAGQVEATLDLVIADARTGRVGFRARLTGLGPTPDEALTALVRRLFPSFDASGS